MGSQQIFDLSRLNHVRELRTELTRKNEENSSLRAENEMLRHHLHLGILAAQDLAALGAGGRLTIFDGWNLILGADRCVADRDELVASAKKLLEENPDDRAWIVFDGPKENSSVDGRLRISYTGGRGAHRADKLICDFLRMARFTGSLERIEVRTRDRDFLKEVERLKGGK